MTFHPLEGLLADVFEDENQPPPDDPDDPIDPEVFPRDPPPRDEKPPLPPLDSEKLSQVTNKKIIMIHFLIVIFFSMNREIVVKPKTDEMLKNYSLVYVWTLKLRLTIHWK